MNILFKVSIIIYIYYIIYITYIIIERMWILKCNSINYQLAIKTIYKTR